MNNLLLVIAALFLVALNGFFVAAEFSLVKLRQTRIRAIAKTHGTRGRILATVHRQLDAYLSACQLGITLASLGLGWIGEPAFAGLLEPVFGWIGITNVELIHGVSFIFAFFVISFLHIVVGELAPKTMAIRNPEVVGMWSALPLYGFYWMMYPAIWLLNASANGLLKLFGLAQGHGHDTQYSADELKLILRSSRSGERFTPEEWNVLAQTLDFSELEVSDLLRPINEVAALHANLSLQDNLQIIYRNRFSRYPYFDTDGVTVLGVVHMKDLFFAQQEGKSIDSLKDYLRPVQYISSRMSALALFRLVRSGAPHFAIIGKKGMIPRGFITLDNLLGALVGEIRDEFRLNDNDWKRLDDGTLVGKGSLPIFSLARILGGDIEEIEDVDSVGGLIMAKLGDLPQEGQKVSFDGFDIVVTKMNGPKIVLVKVYPATKV
ncbi:hemolysin family protein [Glaciimonas immobilis]|uniref:CBS domain containing-hemolysin-like protein n=1 Tax=Glaciimonas immobilis TaxID=728004 RepID=A0A840RRJ6_9BURK|nr:hemolysin family protein [Glaciimonas immobilis]KAF3998086.1 HlyC/CorC family transporter [Glaciimonas immobilis]MBB5199221.1 CBS domain containing-hemolysin-like protein [Glaciimonas immobilis]